VNTFSSGTTIIFMLYGIFLIAAISFSFLINSLLLKFSMSLGSRSERHRHIIRWSSTLKPSLGGFSFYILFLISIATFGFFTDGSQEYLSSQLFGTLLAVNLGFLLGLTDDAYNTIPALKFFAQLSCGLLLVVTNNVIPATGIYAADAAITLIWVVGIMNSINMLDNMDGISGIVSLFILVSCMLVLCVEHTFFSIYTMMMLGVAGALIGFLAHNIHPSRIYMGDTGSQLLGAFIAATSIHILWKYHAPVGSIIQLKQFLIPLIAFLVPIIDTSTVVIHRIARGQSPFIGGKDHITHHFVYAGLNDKQVMYLIGGFSAISAFMTGTMVYYYDQLTISMVIAGYTYFLTAFLVTQYFYEVGKRKELRQSKSKSLRPSTITTPAHKSVPA